MNDIENTLSNLSIYTFPAPTQLSWQLLCALRLANLEIPDIESEDAVDRAMQPWREVLYGFAESISDANNSAVRSDVLRLSDILRQRSDDRLQKLEQINKAEGSGWESWAYRAIKKLWEEERTVANGLSVSLANGYVFE